MPWPVPLSTVLLAVALAQDPAGSAAPDQGSMPVVLDRVVAVVEDRIITASDVRLEAALVRFDPSPIEVLQQRRREDALEVLIDAAVIRNLAGDIAIYAPSTAEVQRRFDGLRTHFDTRLAFRAFLRENGLDAEVLAGRLYARMVAERYVARNVQLASEAAGDNKTESYIRYLEWVASERERVPIRRVPQQDPR